MGRARGSVTFCDAATPTVARVCAQRDATAGLDEQISDAEGARGGVSGDEGERHLSASLTSLITAVASISTSHSGRASASTTRPVETG